jgi:hypothetical protein
MNLSLDDVPHNATLQIPVQLTLEGDVLIKSDAEEGTVAEPESLTMEVMVELSGMDYFHRSLENVIKRAILNTSGKSSHNGGLSAKLLNKAQVKRTIDQHLSPASGWMRYWSGEVETTLSLSLSTGEENTDD